MATIADRFTAAVERRQAGLLDAAKNLCEEILVEQPRHADALHLLGVIMHQRNDFEMAVKFIGEALAINSTASYYVDLAASLTAIKRTADAAQSFRQALQINPQLAIAHYGLGELLYQDSKYEEALNHFQTATHIAPNVAKAHASLGNTLFQRGELASAVAAYRRALALRPNLPTVHGNLGLALTDLGEFEEAIAHCRRAIALSPNAADAHNNLSLALLLQGRFAEAWPHHEWRNRATNVGIDYRRFNRPPWCGTPLDGARILLHAEQGIGDTIQFVRYAPLVAARGGRVLLEVPPELKRLVESITGVEQVIGKNEPLPEFAEHCPLLSLPLAFGTDLASIPSEVPYLQPDSTDISKWKTRFKATPGLHVGLVWGGRPEHRRDRDRSIPLAALAPLSGVDDVVFYSLQKGAAAAQIAARPADLTLHDIGPELHDFSDTAAAIAALDLIITVDTSVAHVAGAIGQKIWILLPHVPDWRWLLGRTDTPWYPTARLFRQPAPDSWAPVIERLTVELTNFCRTLGPSPQSVQRP